MRQAGLSVPSPALQRRPLLLWSRPGGKSDLGGRCCFPRIPQLSPGLRSVSRRLGGSPKSLRELFPFVRELLPKLRELFPFLRELLRNRRESLPPVQELFPNLCEPLQPVRELSPNLCEPFPSVRESLLDLREHSRTYGTHSRTYGSHLRTYRSHSRTHGRHSRTHGSTAVLTRDATGPTGVTPGFAGDTPEPPGIAPVATGMTCKCSSACHGGSRRYPGGTFTRHKGLPGNEGARCVATTRRGGRRLFAYRWSWTCTGVACQKGVPSWVARE